MPTGLILAPSNLSWHIEQETTLRQVRLLAQ